MFDLSMVPAWVYQYGIPLLLITVCIWHVFEYRQILLVFEIIDDKEPVFSSDGKDE